MMEGTMTTTIEEEEDCQLLLPDEITTEILSRLPAESVMQCKRVCKTWRALVADPVFIDLYHQKAVVVEWVTLCNKEKIIGCPFDYHLHFGEYNDNNDDVYGKRNISNPFKHSQPIIYQYPITTLHRKLSTVCSCNGLIFSMSILANNMFVCNPFTREYVDLPLPLSFGGGFNPQDISLATGFGYNSYTNEYKIVIIYRYRRINHYVTIYTLGSGRWRDKGQIFSPKLINGSEPGVFVNGALHWLTKKKEIVSFDLVDELFRIVPSPPSSSSQSDHVPQLGLLGGCLCVTRKRSTLDIWVMDNELQSWTRKFSIALELGGNLSADGYRPLALSKSGKLILFHNHFCKPLVSYDPETETSIVDNSFSKSNEIYMQIRYIKSFVSLKTLGETNAVDQIYDGDQKSMICKCLQLHTQIKKKKRSCTKRRRNMISECLQLHAQIKKKKRSCTKRRRNEKIRHVAMHPDSI